MQGIPNLLQIRNSIKTLCEVDSTIIKSMSAMNDKLDIHNDILSGFGVSQILTNILIGGLIIVGIMILIIKRRK